MKAKNLTKDEIIDKLREHRNDLEKYGIKRIGLFCSFVRGEQKKKSDIDLVVEFLVRIVMGFLMHIWSIFYSGETFGKKSRYLNPCKY